MYIENKTKIQVRVNYNTQGFWDKGLKNEVT
jgi:hypothetical protein